MEKLKFILFSIIILALIALVGYWALTTLQSGTEYVASQKVKQLEKENEDLTKEVQKQRDELSVLQAKLEEPVLDVAKESAPQPEVSKSVSTPATVYKYQALINELQKLINDNIYMKLKSSGSRVGTVQNFLNIYNNTSNKVDNDYGASTQKAVMDFQKDARLSADGEAGPSTFIKMIDWLKKQR